MEWGVKQGLRHCARDRLTRDNNLFLLIPRGQNDVLGPRCFYTENIVDVDELDRHAVRSQLYADDTINSISFRECFRRRILKPMDGRRFEPGWRVVGKIIM